MNEPIVVGLSHLSASVSVRERLAAPAPLLPAALESLRRDCPAAEAAILSTCSRFEVYAAAEPGAASGAAAEALRAWVARRAQADVLGHLYTRRAEEAAHHLFRVSAGLDSWVLGETEILGQVKTAYLEAQKARSTGRTLNILFQRALAAGKEVRTKTPIAEGITSIGGAAAVLAHKVFGESGTRSVLIFGAGAMAKTAAKHLLAKGKACVQVANRTQAKAEELASNLGGFAVPWEQALGRLADVDVAVFSTASMSALVDAKGLAPLLGPRRGRPLFLIDIGLPRNVDCGVTRLDGVYLYDLDDLKRMVEKNRSARQTALEAAGAICRSWARDYWTRLTAPQAQAARRIAVPQ